MATHEETITAAGSGTSLVTGNIGAGTDMLYLVAIAVRSNRAISSVTGGGLTFTQKKAQCSGRDNQGVNIWEAFGSPGSAFTVTVNLSTSSNAIAVSVSRYSGADSTTPTEDAQGSNTNGANGACSGGTDGSAASITTTATNANSVHFVATNRRNRDISTADADYTDRASVQAGSGGDDTRLSIHDYTKTASGADTCAHTLSGSTDWCMAAIVIIPASGGEDYTEDLTDTIAATDSETNTAAAAETLSSDIAITNTLSELLAGLEDLTDTIAATDSETNTAAFVETLNYSLSVLDALTAAAQYAEAVLIIVPSQNTLQAIAAFLENLQESIGAQDGITEDFTGPLETLTDTIISTVTAAATAAGLEDLTDTIAATDSETNTAAFVENLQNVITALNTVSDSVVVPATTARYEFSHYLRLNFEANRNRDFSYTKVRNFAA